jgi:hypothetical protein
MRLSLLRYWPAQRQLLAKHLAVQAPQPGLV